MEKKCKIRCVFTSGYCTIHSAADPFRMLYSKKSVIKC